MDDCSRGIKLEQISECFKKIKSELGCVVQSSEVSDPPCQTEISPLLSVLSGEGDGGRPRQETSAGAGSGSALQAAAQQQTKQQLRPENGEEDSQYYYFFISTKYIIF